LRRDPKFAHSAVVAISVGGRDAREATISAGADLFLDKPVVLRDLFRTQQVLSQRGALA
jgi:CheY-like chemotaxis protein